MVLDGVIEDSIKTFRMLNMAVSLSDVYLDEYLLQKYILPYALNLKAVVIEFSPGLLYRTTEYLDWVMDHSPGLVYEKKSFVRKYLEDIADYSQDQEYPRNIFPRQYIEGTFLLPPGGWAVPNVLADTTEMPFDSPMFQNSLNVFKNIKRVADSCGIEVVAVITPRNPAYRETGAYDIMGPSRTVAKKLIQAVADMGYPILDENKGGLHDYTEEMAANEYHVSYLGAAQFSVRLDSLLNVLSKKN